MQYAAGGIRKKSNGLGCNPCNFKVRQPQTSDRRRTDYTCCKDVQHFPKTGGQYRFVVIMKNLFNSQLFESSRCISVLIASHY